MMGIFWFLIGFGVSLYLAFLIWLLIADRHKCNRIEEFMKRHMKPIDYLKLKEMEKQPIWATMLMK